MLSTKKNSIKLGNSTNIFSFKQAGIIVSLFCVILLQSCSQKGKKVASVDGISLYENEVLLLMEHLGHDLSDTLIFKEIVNEWCIDQVFINELASQNEDASTINRLRTHSYEGDLGRYEIEKVLIAQQLDTIVSEDEILNYFQKNKEEFILHDYIVKAFYLKIPREVDFKKEGIHKFYLLKNDKDIVEINAFAKIYAENYYFNDSTWIFFNELVKDVPISKYNVDNIVLNRTKTYFSDDRYTYFINIIDFKLKNEVPPVDFLKNDIRKIILTKRVLQLKEKNESKLIQRIKEKHEIISKY